MASTDQSDGVPDPDGAHGARRQDRWLYALVGAVVTVVTAFIPLSPVLGGGVAGYLATTDDREGLRIGALSGLIAAVPIVAIFGLVVLVMFFGMAVSGEVAGPLFVVTVLLVIGAFVVGYTVALSAVGGFLGAALAEARGDRSAAAPAEAEPSADR